MPIIVTAIKKAMMAPVLTVGSVRSFKLAPQRLQKLRPGVMVVPQVEQNIDIPSALMFEKSLHRETAAAADKFRDFRPILLRAKSLEQSARRRSKELRSKSYAVLSLKFILCLRSLPLRLHELQFKGWH
jgi:hypothetical protein